LQRFLVASSVPEVQFRGLPQNRPVPHPSVFFQLISH
jgi:hypothetical protein